MRPPYISIGHQPLSIGFARLSDPYSSNCSLPRPGPERRATGNGGHFLVCYGTGQIVADQREAFPMLDIRIFRETPDLVRQSQIKRGEDPGLVDQVLALDTRRRELQTRIDGARAERNTVSALIPKIKDPAEKQERITAMRALGG